jgi:rhodanese-related sulfurtransferase
MRAWTVAGAPTQATPITGPVEAPGLRVLDIRQSAEFEAGHVPGAVHIELGSLAERVGGFAAGPTVVMCGHGERAMGAASVLERAGRRDVIVLEGGPEEWAAANGQHLVRGP